MKTTVLTGFVATALLVCGLVAAVHLALSGLDHIVIAPNQPGG